eukprot:502566-Rhodomonas_salina.1
MCIIFIFGVTSANANECTNGTHNCDANSVCHDTPGSFVCECNAGFENRECLARCPGYAYDPATVTGSISYDLLTDCPRCEGTRAYYFPDNVGDNDGVCLGTEPTGSTVTMMLWVYASNAGPQEQWRRLMEMGVSGAEDAIVLYWGALELEKPSLLLRDPITELFLSDTLPRAEWHHLAATVNENAATIYYDGVLEFTTALPSPTNAVARKLCIGNSVSAPGRSFRGRLADPRVFPRALSAQEIADIYNGTATAPSDLQEWNGHGCSSQCARTTDTTCTPVGSSACAAGAHNCDANAACTPTNGSFTCACDAGWAAVPGTVHGTDCLNYDECTPDGGITWTHSGAGTVSNPSGLTDGIIDVSQWSTGGAWWQNGVSSCASFVTIIFDLKAVREINAITSYPYWHSTRSYCSQSIAVSATGAFGGEETTLFSCTDFADCGPETSAGRSAVITEPIAARYVRVRASKSDADGGAQPAIHILEIVIDYTGKTNLCSPHAACSDTNGSFTCACGAAYEGNGTSCTPVDSSACAVGAHNCDSNAVCTPTNGSFTCPCLHGFKPWGKSWYEENCFFDNGVKARPVDAMLQLAPSASILISESVRESDVIFVAKAIFPQPADDAMLFELGGSGLGLWVGILNGNFHIQGGTGSVAVVPGQMYAETSYLVVAPGEFPADNAAHTVIIEYTLSESGKIRLWIDSGYVAEGVQMTTSAIWWAGTDPGTYGATALQVCVGTVETAWGGAIIEDLLIYVNTPRVGGCFQPNCTDVDECTTGAHDCDAANAVCTNTNGSFTCACETGYEGNGTSCTPMDTSACAVGAHNCDVNAVCTNTNGSFTCACSAGWESSDNGVTCTEVEECGPPGDIQVAFTAVNGAVVSTFTETGCTGCGPVAGVTLDGIDDYATLDTITFPAGDVTYSMRVFAEAAPSYARIFDFGNGQAIDNHLIMFQPSDGPISFLSEAGPERETYDTPNAFPMNQWVHLTVVISGGTVQIYIYGVSVVNETITPRPSAITLSSNLIGKSNWAGNGMFKGKIADLRIYSRALSTAEVRACNDECALGLHDCNVNAVCTDTGGSFTCACNTGYDGDGVSCDVNECTIGTHDCDASAICTKTNGSFTCSCATNHFALA